MLKRNIRNLVKQHNTTISQLAADIGMSQSNMSKRLSENDDSTRFTLEQVYDIAERFGVSVDELLGHKVSNKQVPTKEICRFLVGLLEEHQVRVIKHEKDEEYQYPPRPERKHHVIYNALYFPNYFYEREAVDEDAALNLRTDIEFGGNNLPENEKINDFLNHYLDIRDRHDDGQYSDENYKILLDAYYKMLEN